MKKIVHLWESVGVFLIIEAPTGVFYSNQVGGTGCGHPEVEGYLVPVERYSDMEEIENITRDYWHDGALKQLSKSAMKQLARAIQGLSVIIGDGSSKSTFCTIDGERLDTRNGEAWIPVKTPWGPGWLTWENSD